ncbi:FtsK/SpoIIIE domain-containing protein [Robertmurraya sp. DFI.2.37]|uniref:FtsK/SpoIIIE domain-containing protein n=1 Tax=Robertmurraya sp. DFI.2.37 TaxID=3031819 RepID=UPI001245E427|nr:FtsK/SpoIIIE domain-containing protein [Robertmurraya sp. DFI.2.37]MDF1507610.1 FtsK/SpoIIIE domain-containing protein [Robertmurraya sp. DFI.2.37]
MFGWLLLPIVVLGAAFIPNKKLANWDYSPLLLREGSWLVPIGKDRKVIYHNFEDYPHLLVGGTTRFGKTVLLKSIFTSLILSNPKKVRLFILDLKGGLEFWKYRNEPEVATVACDLIEACKVLDKVYKIIKLEEERFRKNNWSNIKDTPIKERTFIIVDEGAELAPKFVPKELRKYADIAQIYLGEIARIGGGLGYRLIFCTQYPVRDAVPAQVKINMVAKVSYRMAERMGSMVVLGEPGAEEIEAIPGRCIYKIEQKKELQSPFISDEMIGRFLHESGKDGNVSAND